jgi:hypothetical protein
MFCTAEQALFVIGIVDALWSTLVYFLQKFHPAMTWYKTTITTSCDVWRWSSHSPPLHCSLFFSANRDKTQKYNVQTPFLKLRFGWLERTEEKQKHHFPLSSALNYALKVGVFNKVLT